MNQIKSAYIYGIPVTQSVDELAELLIQVPFKEPQPAAKQSCGFIDNPHTGQLVSPIEGGWVVCMRTDEKILPASVLNKAVSDKVAEIEKEQDRQVYRKEKLQIRDDVMLSMLPVAFIKTRYTYAYYHAQEALLIVGAGAAGAAEEMISLLREAFGSFKAVPLRIDQLTHELTERLRSYVSGLNFDLGSFDLGKYLQMTGQNDQVLTLKEKESVGFGLGQVEDALSSGYQVNEISLVGDGCQFKLKSDLSFKSICFDDPADPPEFDSVEEHWRNETAIQVLVICQQVKALLALCGSLFPEPVKEGQ